MASDDDTPHPQSRGAPSNDIDPTKHPLGIIILSQATVKEIRFTISKDYFKTASNYDRMPDRIMGELLQWTNKDEMTLKIYWPVDETNTVSSLASILDADYKMKLEKYADNRSAPKARGMHWRRDYSVAMTSGPYAPSEQARNDEEDIHITYKEGTREFTQTWKRVTPQAVREDWCPPIDRFRLKTTLGAHKTNTFEKVLFNVCLLKNLAADFTRWFNRRLPDKQKTSVGEIVKFWGLMIAAAQFPCIPFKRLWRREPKPGDIMPPANFGRFGMTKERARVLMQQHQRPYDPDERGFQECDPSRYIRALVQAFNDSREKLVVPSWLLVGDESMWLWLGAEGVPNGIGANPFGIPNLSFIERKPDPLGAELKVLADGNCGIFLRLEFQEDAEMHVKQQFYDEYGHSTAVSLRLLQPYFKANEATPSRAYYADSWFMGVHAAEAIHYEAHETDTMLHLAQSLHALALGMC